VLRPRPTVVLATLPLATFSRCGIFNARIRFGCWQPNHRGTGPTDCSNCGLDIGMKRSLEPLVGHTGTDADHDIGLAVGSEAPCRITEPDGKSLVPQALPNRVTDAVDRRPYTRSRDGDGSAHGSFPVHGPLPRSVCILVMTWPRQCPGQGRWNRDSCRVTLQRSRHGIANIGVLSLLSNHCKHAAETARRKAPRTAPARRVYSRLRHQNSEDQAGTHDSPRTHGSARDHGFQHLCRIHAGLWR
jgi:hypothetical protein